MNSSGNKTGIIVLAAGFSRRFKGDKRQARLADGRSLLQASLDAVPASFTERVLVLHPGDDDLAATHRTWHSIIATDAVKGLGHSLAQGIAVAIENDWSGALITLGDMPFIKAETFEKVRSALQNAPAAIPVCAGRRGHPTDFSKILFNELAVLTGDTGARAILSRYADQVAVVDCNDEGIWQDVDTVEDLPI